MDDLMKVVGSAPENAPGVEYHTMEEFQNMVNRGFLIDKRGRKIGCSKMLHRLEQMQEMEEHEYAALAARRGTTREVSMHEQESEKVAKYKAERSRLLKAEL